VTGQFVAQSASYLAEIARPPVANPHFAWWTLDEGSGRQVPFPWRLSLANLSSQAGGISLLNQTFSSGVQFRVNSTDNSGTTGELVLSQKLFFNETNVSILLSQPRWNLPLNMVALGARATDGTHTLYFLFSGEASTLTVARYAENTTVTMPIAYSVWNTVTLNTKSVWQSQGWSIPTSLDFSIFLRSSTSGTFLASVREVVLASSQAG